MENTNEVPVVNKGTITTVEVEKELHLRVAELAKLSGMKVKGLVAYLLEDGMKRFKENHSDLLNGKVTK